MKRFLTTLLLAVGISAAVNAQDGSGQYVDFQIVAQDDMSTTIYRSPAVVPVRGYYTSLSNTLYLYFSLSLGKINVIVEYEDTGETSSMAIPSETGIHAISLFDRTGNIRITLISSGCAMYSGEIIQNNA